MLQIATAADFCGTRWQNNAVMIPVPGGKAYLMPVALIMALYRAHSGQKSLRVKAAPADGTVAPVESAPPDHGATVAATTEIEVLSVTEGAVEMRSGPVRLMLFTAADTVEDGHQCADGSSHH